MHRRTDTLLLTGVLTHTDIQKGWYAGMIHNTPFHWVLLLFILFHFVTLLILFITSSYNDKLCLYQSLFLLLFIPVTLLFLLIPVT